uniref:Uncharacterized protein n=1 Tax=Bombyx mori TaxID=7091 RepID=Q8MTQ3_BOMMO|nr:putative protein [Bombyx mori]
MLRTYVRANNERCLVIYAYLRILFLSHNSFIAKVAR